MNGTPLVGNVIQRALEKRVERLEQDMTILKALIQQNNDNLQSIIDAVEKEKAANVN